MSIIRWIAAVALLGNASCSDEGERPESGHLGAASISLTSVPADAHCLQVTVEGARTVQRTFDLSPDDSSVLMLSGLPVGSSTFTALAYGTSCSSVDAETEATWQSDPVVAIISLRSVAAVTLRMRRTSGRADVSIDFDEDDAGDAGAECDAGDQNEAPTPAPDEVSTVEDTQVVIALASLLANDTDPEGDRMTVTALGNALHGTVTLAGTDAIFTPSPDFVGDASFDYTVVDEAGGSATGTVRVTVTRVRVVALSSGTETCALLEDGTVKCVGGDEPLDFGSDRKATALDCGSSHSCALFDDGAVTCWGGNNVGQLGRGDNLPHPAEAEPGATADLGTGRRATAIATGGAHTCALLDDGAVKCWGDNWYGQLGLGDTMERGEQPGEMGDALPTVALGTGRTALAVTGGDDHTCALLNDGTATCWGLLTRGRMRWDSVIVGDGSGEMGNALPRIDLGTNRTARSIDAGYDHTCAVLDNGTAKCWGENKYGQLGLGDTTGRWDPLALTGDALPAVELGAGRTVMAVSVAEMNTCALLDDASVKCWGRNSNGELGLGDTNPRGDQPGEMGDALPRVDLGEGRTVQALAGSGFRFCALLDDASVKCWGRGAGGGQGDQPGEMGDALPVVDF